MNRLNQTTLATALVTAVTAVGTAAPAAAGEPASVIYLVRHAETETDGTDPADPPLSAPGEARAAALAAALADAGLVSVHATGFERTRQTAQAAAPDLEVESYDPSDGAAAERLLARLRSVPGGHLVVGHSNTVPALVEALGGDPVAPIAHAEYDRLYVVVISGGEVSSVLLHYGVPDEVPPAGRAVPGWPLAERLQESCLTFGMSFDGETVGSSTFETRADGDGWRFTETSRIERFQVDAVNRAHAGMDLRPTSFSAGGTMFGHPVEIEVEFDDAHAEGTSRFPRQDGPETLSIDAALPPDTLERTSAFFVVAAFPFEQEALLRFHWFTTYTGEVRQIVAAVEGREDVETPAGVFATWKVDLRGGNPGQVLWLSRDAPYRIVRIEVVGQPWVYELERVSETCGG